MANAAMRHLSRNERRSLLSAETYARASGEWGKWELHNFPNGVPGSRNGGWCKEVKSASKNKVFCVLHRPVPGAIHLAVTSLSGKRPTWHEMQRIKNEVAGRSSFAIEIYPPNDQVVDEADMFHIWVLSKPLPFSIYERPPTPTGESENE